MKVYILKYIVVLFSVLVPNIIVGQQVSTLYFVENAPMRNMINPAFQPLVYFYVNLPVIGLFQMHVSNNSLVLKDIIYKNNGETFSFVNSEERTNHFFNDLKSTTLINTDLQTNLFSFGYKHINSFWSFSLSEKIDGKVGIPKDLIRFSLYGTTDKVNNSYNLKTLQTDFTLYSEAAFGFAYKLSDHCAVGVKLKYLYGLANVSNSNQYLSVDIGTEQLNFNVKGTANTSSQAIVEIGEKFKSVKIITPENNLDWYKPSGQGVGLDLGVDFRISKNINLSASIIDLGFIKWEKNVQNLNYSLNYNYEGTQQNVSLSENASSLWDNIYNQLISQNNLVDSLVTAFRSSSVLSKSYNVYTTTTTVKLNLGAEYTLSNNYISFGLLSRTFFFNKTVNEELTLSLNAKPNEWLNTSLSYSFLNNNISSFGAGFGLRTSFIHWLFAADYIPFYKAALPITLLGANNPNVDIPIPYNSKNINFCVGITLVFDEVKPSNGLINKNEIIRKKRGFFQPRSRNTYNLNWVNQKSGLIH